MKRVRSEHLLKESKGRFPISNNLPASILENVFDISVYALDRKLRYIFFNSKHLECAKRLWGTEPQNRMNIFEVIGIGEHRAFWRRTFDQALDGSSLSVETAHMIDGDRCPVNVYFNNHVSPLFNDYGEIAGVTVLATDITRHIRMEAELAAQERMFRTLVEHSPDTIARYGRDLRRLYVNPAFAALVEEEADSLIGKTPRESPGGSNAAVYEQKLRNVFTSGKALEFELKWKSRSGNTTCSLIHATPEFDKDGTVESILTVGRDITELTEYRRKIHRMAFYDPLTTLPNRALFNDRLRQMIADASRHGRWAGVMLLDLDHFKTVNDTMGHAAGDELLRKVAARLTTFVRVYDTVARLGGDEFAILIPQIHAAADLGRIAEKALRLFNNSFILGGKEVFISCSIGIALYPLDCTEPHDLLKFADSAMYYAKRSGRNSYRFYSKELTGKARERLAMESELRHAVERSELELYYQPQVALHDGRLTGAEALLMWRHPRLGMLPADRFIQIAEDTGLIAGVGEWVFREACRAASEWNTSGRPPHKLAINLSARQFQSRDLVMKLVRILDETVCRPEWLELEITENLLLGGDGMVLDMLKAFRSMGILIAIDDFGAGYASLSCLARFPIDTVKIDGSFINTVIIDYYHTELVKTILSVARCLGQNVVAEGVETAEQADFLKANGCQMAQGILFSRALPRSGFLSLPQFFMHAGSVPNAGVSISDG